MELWHLVLLVFVIAAAVTLWLLAVGETVGSMICPLDTLEPGRTGVRILVKREGRDPLIPTVHLQFRTIGAIRAVRMRPEQAMDLATVLENAASQARQELQ
ncbi:MAG: hypothetical protein ACXWAC_07620 [Usitatibacter sp.]